MTKLAPIAALALRTYLRYLVPLTLLSAIALAPWWLVALGTPVPPDAANAKRAVRLGWMLAGSAWIGQLVLVGGAAPLVRALDAPDSSGAAISQLRAFGRGFVSLARAIVPGLAVAAAVVMGSMALVLPGLALLVLLSLTAASTRRGLPAPLADSVEVVRQNLALVAGVVAAMIAIDLAIAFATNQLTLPTLPKKPKAEQLALYRQHVHIVAGALVVVGPLFAALLAAIHTRGSKPS